MQDWYMKMPIKEAARALGVPPATVRAWGDELGIDRSERMFRRTGCIYSEVQNNTGKGVGRGLGLTDYRSRPRLRWVASIMYLGKRIRFRSTNYFNVANWLEKMSNKLSDYPL